MDALLARLGYQAVNVALRSGISITSALAIQQCSRLLKTVDDTSLRLELKTLQGLLSSKIKILSPAIELIELKSGRGNVFLESAVPLVKSLQSDIIALGQHLENATAMRELPLLNGASKARATQIQYPDLAVIIREIKDLLARIDREIPLIQLAITASGESLSTTLPPQVSPSRLLQAAMFLNIGDAHFAGDPSRPVQIGPNFTVSLYMLFVGHSAGQSNEPGQGRRLHVNPSSSEEQHEDQPPHSGYDFGEEGKRPIWTEVVHKCRVRLCRNPQNWVFDRTVGYQPPSPAASHTDNHQGSEVWTLEQEVHQYSYHLEMVEDFDDGRVHDDESGKYGAFDSVQTAGIRESVPVHQIAKIFYADTGRILNLGNEEGGNNPVLLLKRDVDAQTPIRKEDWWQQARSVEEEEGGIDAVRPDEQLDIDRQLREEIDSSSRGDSEEPKWWQFPQHLDREWLALEVFTGDDEAETESEEERDESRTDPRPRITRRKQRSSVDSDLLGQIRKFSLGSSPPRLDPSRPSSRDLEKGGQSAPQSLVAASPFGAVASSLSLMEMLIRLTSLQEFQQASHLSIPDHILTFFLEETSTTGLRGEGRWKARSEAKKKVGFDPYTDTPTK